MTNTNNDTPETKRPEGLTDIEWLRVLLCRRANGTLADERIRLPHADFRGADLSGLYLANCAFHYSTFKGANLSGVTFDGCNLYGCIFDDADLSHASLYLYGDQPTNANGASFVHAICIAMEAATASFVSTTFAEANVSHASFQQTNLYEAVFARANCTSANFKLAAMGSANFTNAICSHASFEQVQFMGNADFSGATLTSASFNDADCAGAILDVNSARVHHASFTRAKGVS